MNDSQNNNPDRISKRIVDIVFALSVLFFIIAFNFQDTPRGSWYKQYLPDLNGRSISDMTFIDSLNGFAVTNGNSGAPGYILKTTTGGDNWEIKYSLNVNFERVQFANSSTGYVCAYVNQLFKTTNAGENWFLLTLPSDLFADDMWVLNKDTLWLAQSESLVGGLFRSTNGGLNWMLQFYSGATNPKRIYMYNKDIGFMYTNLGFLKKTTDGGFNWSLTDGGSYQDLYFIDTLKGWIAWGNIKLTTNGGINWVTKQVVPLTNQIWVSQVSKLSVLNKDTIWGFGYTIYQFPNYQNRGLIQKSINGGNNWGYQMPDTSFGINEYDIGHFINKRVGWAYRNSLAGIHTTNGGLDTLIMVGINENNTNTPKDFILEQNYPNPFNSITKIKYKITNTEIRTQKSGVRIIIYNIIGKEISILVNKMQSPGNYEVKFDGSNLSTGIYFYTLFVDGIRIDMKKMLLIK